jgi:penicillin V acylase-like amidase (Ntn superfamily)
MTSETVLKQVRDRLGPLNGQAEQAVAEAVEIIRQMSEPPSSPITEDGFKGENVSLEEYESWSDKQQRHYLVEAKKTM